MICGSSFRRVKRLVCSVRRSSQVEERDEGRAAAADGSGSDHTSRRELAGEGKEGIREVEEPNRGSWMCTRVGL